MMTNVVYGQSTQYYMYNMVSFDGNTKREGLKVYWDDGTEVKKLTDSKGNVIKFKTTAAALMYFVSKGWDLYVSGATTSGFVANGTGGSSTTSYWILRRPCSKDEFEKAVRNGIGGNDQQIKDALYD